MSDSSLRHDERVERFCSDLRTLPLTDIIRKHITTGAPYSLSDDSYFELRRVVAEQFDVHPSAVVIVGSCRNGFSIAPKKRYREVLAASDLDLALVSAETFDQYWNNVFAYAVANSAWRRSHRYRQFMKTLFDGWIDPRGLPPVSRFDHAKQWMDFFDELMQSRRFGNRRISARLYRTWARLESYHERAVRKCIAHLGSNDEQRKHEKS